MAADARDPGIFANAPNPGTDQDILLSDDVTPGEGDLPPGITPTLATMGDNPLESRAGAAAQAYQRDIPMTGAPAARQPQPARMTFEQAMAQGRPMSAAPAAAAPTSRGMSFEEAMAQGRPRPPEPSLWERGKQNIETAVTHPVDVASTVMGSALNVPIGMANAVADLAFDKEPFPYFQPQGAGKQLLASEARGRQQLGAQLSDMDFGSDEYANPWPALRELSSIHPEQQLKEAGHPTLAKAVHKGEDILKLLPFLRLGTAPAEAISAAADAGDYGAILQRAREMHREMGFETPAEAQGAVIGLRNEGNTPWLARKGAAPELRKILTDINKDVTQVVAKHDAGVPINEAISPESLERGLEAPNSVYERVFGPDGMNIAPLSPENARRLRTVTRPPNEAPNAAVDDALANDIEYLTSQPLTPQILQHNLAKLRRDGFLNLGREGSPDVPDPTAQAIGRAQLAAADILEDHIGANINTWTGQVTREQFEAARTAIARNRTVYYLTRGGLTKDINFVKLVNMYEKMPARYQDSALGYVGRWIAADERTRYYTGTRISPEAGVSARNVATHTGVVEQGKRAITAIPRMLGGPQATLARGRPGITQVGPNTESNLLGGGTAAGEPVGGADVARLFFPGRDDSVFAPVVRGAPPGVRARAGVGSPPPEAGLPRAFRPPEDPTRTDMLSPAARAGFERFAGAGPPEETTERAATREAQTEALVRGAPGGPEFQSGLGAGGEVGRTIFDEPRAAQRPGRSITGEDLRDWQRRNAPTRVPNLSEVLREEPPTTEPRTNDVMRQALREREQQATVERQLIGEMQRLRAAGLTDRQIQRELGPIRERLLRRLQEPEEPTTTAEMREWRKSTTPKVAPAPTPTPAQEPTPLSEALRKSPPPDEPDEPPPAPPAPAAPPAAPAAPAAPSAAAAPPAAPAAPTPAPPYTQEYPSHERNYAIPSPSENQVIRPAVAKDPAARTAAEKALLRDYDMDPDMPAVTRARPRKGAEGKVVQVSVGARKDFEQLKALAAKKKQSVVADQSLPPDYSIVQFAAGPEPRFEVYRGNTLVSGGSTFDEARQRAIKLARSVEAKDISAAAEGEARRNAPQPDVSEIKGDLDPAPDPSVIPPKLRASVDEYIRRRNAGLPQDKTLVNAAFQTEDVGAAIWVSDETGARYATGKHPDGTYSAVVLHPEPLGELGGRLQMENPLMFLLQHEEKLVNAGFKPPAAQPDWSKIARRDLPEPELKKPRQRAPRAGKAAPAARLTEQYLADTGRATGKNVAMSWADQLRGEIAGLKKTLRTTKPGSDFHNAMSAKLHLRTQQLDQELKAGARLTDVESDLE
jgi:hypothetical protein